MSPIEGLIEAHEINVHDVVHELEELNLCPRGLRNELLHTVQRWHVRLFSTEITGDVAHDVFAIAKPEKKWCVVVGEIERDKDCQGTKRHVQIMAFMS